MQTATRRYYCIFLTLPVSQGDGGGVQEVGGDMSHRECVSVLPRTICPIHHGLFLDQTPTALLSLGVDVALVGGTNGLLGLVDATQFHLYPDYSSHSHSNSSHNHNNSHNDRGDANSRTNGSHTPSVRGGVAMGVKIGCVVSLPSVPAQGTRARPTAPSYHERPCFLPLTMEQDPPHPHPHPHPPSFTQSTVCAGEMHDMLTHPYSALSPQHIPQGAGAGASPLLTHPVMTHSSDAHITAVCRASGDGNTPLGHHHYNHHHQSPHHPHQMERVCFVTGDDQGAVCLWYLDQARYTAPGLGQGSGPGRSAVRNTGTASSYPLRYRYTASMAATPLRIGWSPPHPLTPSSPLLSNHMYPLT